MAKAPSSTLAAAKARVAKLEQADKRKKAVDAAKAAVKKAQTQLAAAKRSPAKKKA